MQKFLLFVLALNFISVVQTPAQATAVCVTHPLLRAAPSPSPLNDTTRPIGG